MNHFQRLFFWLFKASSPKTAGRESVWGVFFVSWNVVLNAQDFQDCT